MSVDRTQWRIGFTKGQFPTWTCSECGGKVALRLEPILQLETAASREAHSHEAWEGSWIQGLFTALLKCGDCNDVAIISGIFTGDEYYDEDESHVFERYEAKYIRPAPSLIQIPKKVPESIRDEVQRAFGLFWADAEACANSLRSVVERILDDHRIQKAPSKKDRGKRLSLHQRLELLRSKKPLEVELLMAAKWIGNAGSHGIPILREDLFDGFDLLEQALSTLYSRAAQQTERLAKRINRGRKPRGKQT